MANADSAAAHCGVTIFVSIAAYRDPELLPAIADCLAKARHPEQLRFGLCWQRGSDEPALPVATDPRVRILDVDWRDSGGACWARAAAMSLWQGEDYFLQIDSHERFAQDRDVKLTDYVLSAPGAKPLLTSYPATYRGGQEESRGHTPSRVAFHYLTTEGIPVFKPVAMPPAGCDGRLYRARFVAAGFLFTSGRFADEVPYDPELYFLGEEISLSVRAYTSGYDLFHPPEVLAWHEYTRAGKAEALGRPR